MKALRSYPGVLMLCLMAVAAMVNGVVDYINFESASPSFLGAAACLVSALALVVVYEIKSFKTSRWLGRKTKSGTY